MNELQKRILNIIQTQLPIERRPFAALAEPLDSDEAEIIEQINQFKRAGIIRRMGAIFDAAHLGYVSTLVAAQVPPEKLDAFVADVNSLPGVSHNYGRNHLFNVWFTLIVPDQAAIDACLADLQKEHGIAHIYSLPAEKMFKIKVRFDFGNSQAKYEDEPSDRVAHEEIAQPSFSQLQIALIRQLQEDLPLTTEPFAVIAENIDTHVDIVLNQIDDWKSAGLIRRFGAAIRHHQAGFTANGMVVFQIEPEDLDEAGDLLAGYQQVSHCYQRPTTPLWPYNLFAITHCKSQPQLRDLVQQMIAHIKPKKYDILISTAEYKKCNVKYFSE